MATDSQPERTLTLIAPVRVHDARQHEVLAQFLREVTKFYNCVAEYDRGVCRHNARVFARHPEDWEPGPDDFQAATECPADPGKLTRYATEYELYAMLATTLQDKRRDDPDDPVVRYWTSAMLRGVVHDYVQCRQKTRAAPGDSGGNALANRRRRRTGCFKRTLRSCTSQRCFRHTLNERSLVVWIGRKGAVKRGIRARLPRPLTDGETVRSLRLVRSQEGQKGDAPSRWAVHVTITAPPLQPRPKRAHPKVLGIDLGGRRTATTDTGTQIPALPLPSTVKTLQRAGARKVRGSNAARRVRSHVRRTQANHARRKRQTLMKHVAVLAQNHDIFVLEELDHAAMRRNGSGKRARKQLAEPASRYPKAEAALARQPPPRRRSVAKRRMNRSLASGSPGQFEAALTRQVDERGGCLAKVPAAHTTRQCLDCGSRRTKLSRTRVACHACGSVRDRDHAAAGNIVLRGIAAYASPDIHTNSGPSRSAGTALSRRPPCSACWSVAPASVTWEVAGDSPERPGERAVRGLARERWGQTPPERRANNSRASPGAEAVRIQPDSRQLTPLAARR